MATCVNLLVFTSLVSFLTRNSDSIDPTKVVSKAEFDAKVAAAYQNTPRIETPAEDIQILANLLGVSPGTLAGSGAGFRKGGEACGHCGRAFSVLDIVETGLEAHSKEFVVDVITGKYGYIANTGAKPFNCHKCGTKCDDDEPPPYSILRYLCINN
ncbi:hypothetical protein FB451DRAFT_1177182 [Mycena latifolia]|nr:hypothetical protein FB451DRAFT_1177182 [Mycena latifolia]